MKREEQVSPDFFAFLNIFCMPIQAGTLSHCDSIFICIFLTLASPDKAVNTGNLARNCLLHICDQSWVQNKILLNENKNTLLKGFNDAELTINQVCNISFVCSFVCSSVRP